MRLLVLCTLLFSVQIHAKIVARVLDVKGNAFVFNSNGQSQQLKFGSKIYDLSEVMVDDSSYISVLDSSDHVHHLAGGTYAKFFNNLLEVKNGYVWTRAKGKKHAIINTINSVIRYHSGQFITSVNNSDLKTQVLSVTASPKLSSSLEPNLAITIPAGHFSFIDQGYERGLPRTPTRVGLNSYKNIKSVFTDVKSLKNTKFEKTLFAVTSSSRGIASVESSRQIPIVNHGKKGKTIFIKTATRKPASVKRESAMDYYRSMVPKPKKKVKSKPKAKMSYYGFDFENKPQKKVVKAKTKTAPVKTVRVVTAPAPKKVAKEVKRIPASIAPARIVDDINSAFEKSLDQKVQNNKRHSNEVNQLIDELKSFKKDYSKHY